MAESSNKPVVLITNDDGIEAPGILAITEALVADGAYEIYVAAPDRERSAISNAITLEPLEVTERDIKGAKAYGISGTPADCILLALSGALFTWTKPTLVVSGINRGSNCGLHIIYSGTVAGAREALMGGVPSVALSMEDKPVMAAVKQAQEEGNLKGVSAAWAVNSPVQRFEAAAQACLPLIRAGVQDALAGTFPKDALLNINVPERPLNEIKGYKLTVQGSERYVKRYAAMPNRRKSGLDMAKQGGMASQLAQLGLAAASRGAARRAANPGVGVRPGDKEEVVSVAAGSSDASPKTMEKKYFHAEVGEHVGGVDGPEIDSTVLAEGWVSITPVGLATIVSDVARKYASSVVQTVGSIGGSDGTEQPKSSENFQSVL
ncbi:5'-nucleotidase [Klebsormidium nitens]|uniref:5'-nucleotidase n=1 Tax=Klebsormidium nitens TaxID=105231 RepID=A0A1Y1IGW7_KLENI|nr:5'-nucleotidase [Klebsormidium nitens]|eukprot:GAQ90110.1 5'-nucleotidase [Klebsormidium nitens]